MAADDIEVIHMTAVEWDQALTNSLDDLGLTWEQLTEQAKAGDFTSLKARHLWLMAAGQGPNQASVEVERLKADLRDAYAERDQQFERKAAALRECNEARQEVERLHSWAGLLALLDEHWPEDIFPTEPDSETRDPGPRIVSLLRWVERLRAELAEAQRTIAAHERHINDTFETNRRNLQKARDQRDEAQDERDALIDEVKTLQEDLEEFGEAQKTWLQFRRERDALKAAIGQVRADAIEQRRATGMTKDPWKLGVYAQACRTLGIFNAAMDGGDCRRDVFVASRTHELRVFTGSVDDAREFAAGLVEQLRDQGPESRNPYIPIPAMWTPEVWRDSKNESALHFRQGVTSCTWFGPAGLEVRIEDAPAVST